MKDKQLIKQISKKLAKDKSVEIIAEEVEEPLDKVQSICSAASTFAPDYDVDKIYDAWKQMDKAFAD